MISAAYAKFDTIENLEKERAAGAAPAVTNCRCLGEKKERRTDGDRMTERRKIWGVCVRHGAVFTFTSTGAGKRDSCTGTHVLFKISTLYV